VVSIIVMSSRLPADVPKLAHLQIEHNPQLPGGPIVIVLGLILLLVGWLVGLGILQTIGIVLIIIGVIFFALGASGRPVGGRNWF
jgi:membrane-bound ClpP family serine protease